MKPFLLKHFPFYLFTIALLLNSCKTELPRSEFVNFKTTPNFEEVLPAFRKTLPKKLSLDQSAVIEIGFKRTATLGLCAFNTDKNEISLALMTTTGMKLIEVENKKGKINTRFSIEELAGKKSASKQLVKDVKIIYFQPDRKPAYCELRKNKLTYGWVVSKERTELIFGKPSENSKIELLSKKLFYDNTPVSIVYYSDYAIKNGKNIPMTVSYENIKFKYSLILKTKKVF